MERMPERRELKLPKQPDDDRKRKAGKLIGERGKSFIELPDDTKKQKEALFKQKIKKIEGEEDVKVRVELSEQKFSNIKSKEDKQEIKRIREEQDNIIRKKAIDDAKKLLTKK